MPIDQLASMRIWASLSISAGGEAHYIYNPEISRIDTKTDGLENDGLENVSPFNSGVIWGIYVEFLLSISFTFHTHIACCDEHSNSRLVLLRWLEVNCLVPGKKSLDLCVEFEHRSILNT